MYNSGICGWDGNIVTERRNQVLEDREYSIVQYITVLILNNFGWGGNIDRKICDREESSSRG